MQLDKDLRERSGGSWEGLTEAEIRGAVPGRAGDLDARRTASPRQAVADRASAALERIADSMPGGSTAVVVSHGAALGMAVARLLEIP